MEVRLTFSIWEIGLLLLLLLCFAQTLKFCLGVYARIPKAPKNLPGPDKKPVSVVIPGKSHSEALKKNLESWLQQEYPCFEIVVVYEKSEEETHEILDDLARKFPQLKLVHADLGANFIHEEKFALSLGVRSARYEHVILSSALFRPVSKQSLDFMQAAFKPGIQAVAGLVLPAPGKKTCGFKQFLRVDKRLQYMGFALSGQAFTAERQWVAYRKDFFLDHQGYTQSYALDTGDFDLLAKHVPDPKAVNVQLAPEAGVVPAFPARESFLQTEKQFQNILSFQRTRAGKQIRLNTLSEALYGLCFVGACTLAGIQFFQTSGRCGKAVGRIGQNFCRNSGKLCRGDSRSAVVYIESADERRFNRNAFSLICMEQISYTVCRLLDFIHEKFSFPFFFRVIIDIPARCEAHISRLGIIVVEKSVPAASEKFCFCVSIGLPCLVIIKVITGKIGEDADFECESEQPLLRNRMRGGFHDGKRIAGFFHF